MSRFRLMLLALGIVKPRTFVEAERLSRVGAERRARKMAKRVWNGMDDGQRQAFREWAMSAPVPWSQGPAVVTLTAGEELNAGAVKIVGGRAYALSASGTNAGSTHRSASGNNAGS